MRNTASPCLMCIAAYGVLLTAPFLATNALVAGHDMQYHYYFLHEFDAGIKDGAFYPRWSQNFSYGRGYPLFVFYPPLAYVIAQLFLAITAHPALSIHMVFILSMLLSGVTMFLFVQQAFGRNEALISSILYMSFPYRFVDLYVRGAMLESLVFALLPLPFWAVHRYSQTRCYRHFLFLAVAVFFLLLAHSLTAGIALMFAVAFSVAVTHEWRKLGMIWLAMAMGAGAAMFYLLPALLETSLVQTEQFIAKMHNYSHHFVYPSQLFNSPWGHGFSGDGLNDGMSFQIGIVPLCFLSASSAVFYWRRRMIDSLHKRLAAFFFGMLLLAVFLMLPASKFLWERLPFLPYIQFPWRFLIFVSFAMSPLGGLWFSPLVNKWSGREQALALSLALLVICASAIRYVDPRYLPIPAFSSKGCIEFQKRLNVPIGVTRWSTETKGNILPLPENATWDPERILISDGEPVSTWGEAVTARTISLSVKASAGAFLVFNKYYYPDWKASVDGKTVDASSAPRSGLLRLYVVEGIHHVKLIYEASALQKWAWAVSLCFVVGLAALGFSGKRSSL